MQACNPGDGLRRCYPYLVCVLPRVSSAIQFCKVRWIQLAASPTRRRRPGGGWRGCLQGGSRGWSGANGVADHIACEAGSCGWRLPKCCAPGPSCLRRAFVLVSDEILHVFKCLPGNFSRPDEQTARAPQLPRLFVALRYTRLSMAPRGLLPHCGRRFRGVPGVTKLSSPLSSRAGLTGWSADVPACARSNGWRREPAPECSARNDIGSSSDRDPDGADAPHRSA